jgi:hypothetical protein
MIVQASKAFIIEMERLGDGRFLAPAVNPSSRILYLAYMQIHN